MSAARSLYALPEVQTMLREQLGLLGAHAARQPSGRALLLHPDATSRGLAADAAHLAATRLFAAGDALAGDVVCSPRALPMEAESFQLVFAQHVADVQPSAGGLMDEIARVMAPGGLLLWCGFNPWSPWLAWIHWHTRGGGAVPQTVNADTLRRRLVRAQLTPLALDYLGTCWPRRVVDNAGVVGESRGARLLAPLRSTYLLAARKQRAVLTPLRPRVARPVSLGARLAGTPSQRACA
ncbi:MAG TPA: methyltransferase domain-containing protein [Rhodanobacteraceae bacterium]